MRRNHQALMNSGYELVNVLTLRKGTMKSNKQTLDDKKINSLFKKFSFPMVKPCISDAQKENAIGLSRILWLLLVTDTDSEQNIYDALKKVFNKHEDNIAMGSLYLYKMKTTLTTKEQLKLRRHYNDQKNFAALKGWGYVD